MSRENVHELEKQVGGRDTHGTGYVLCDVCASPMRCGACRVLGACSDDRGGVGDFCFVVCEVEVAGGRWCERRRDDWLEMRRSRQRCYREGRLALSATPKCGIAARWLPQVLRVQMRRAQEDKRARVIYVVDSALKR